MGGALPNASVVFDLEKSKSTFWSKSSGSSLKCERATTTTISSSKFIQCQQRERIQNIVTLTRRVGCKKKCYPSKFSGHQKEAVSQLSCSARFFKLFLTENGLEFLYLLGNNIFYPDSSQCLVNCHSMLESSINEDHKGPSFLLNKTKFATR